MITVPLHMGIGRVKEKRCRAERKVGVSENADTERERWRGKIQVGMLHQVAFPPAVKDEGMTY